MRTATTILHCKSIFDKAAERRPERKIADTFFNSERQCLSLSFSYHFTVYHERPTAKRARQCWPDSAADDSGSSTRQTSIGKHKQWCNSDKNVDVVTSTKNTARRLAEKNSRKSGCFSLPSFPVGCMGDLNLFFCYHMLC